jgi:hypothetical protein
MPEVDGVRATSNQSMWNQMLPAFLEAQRRGERELPEGLKDRIEIAMMRCAAEIAELSKPQGKPVWLTVLGIEDWEMEKRLIEAGR